MKTNYLQVLMGLLLLTISGEQILAQSGLSQDTLFKEPYTDMDAWRDKPVRHRSNIKFH